MSKGFGWVFLVMLPVGALMGLFVSAVVTYLMPTKYESQCWIELKPLVPVSVESHRKTGGNHFASQIEILKSQDALKSVADRLELSRRWGMDQRSVVEALRGIIAVRQIHGTDLCSVIARHTNKAESKELVEAVVAVYKWRVSEMDRSNLKAAVAGLESAIREQEAKVSKLREELGAFVGGLGKNGRDIGTVKSELDAGQTMLDHLERRLWAEKIASETLSDRVPIHQAPEVPETPVSPKVALNLTLGMVLGILIFPLMAIPFVWLLSRQRAAAS